MNQCFAVFLGEKGRLRFENAVRFYYIDRNGVVVRNLSRFGSKLA